MGVQPDSNNVKEPITDENPQNPEGGGDNNNPNPNPEPTPQPNPEPKPKPESTEPAKSPLELIDALSENELLKSSTVQKLVQNARQQEKDKLYKTVESKDVKIKELEDTVGDLKTQLENKEETQMENEKQLIEKVNGLQEQQQKLLDQIEEEKENARKAELDAYRDKIIRDANGEIIEELVTGNTKEEIEESAERAKQRYEEIVGKYKDQKKEEKKPDPKNAPSPNNPPSDSMIGGEFTSKDIKNMSNEEYKQYRERILREAKQL